MSANGSDRQPRVPDGEPPSLYVNPVTASEIAEAPQEILSEPQEPDPEAALTSPLNPLALVVEYAIEGTNAQRNLSTFIRARANNLRSGKFSKRDVYYTPLSPFPPGLWEYRCSTCQFFRRGDEERNTRPRCEVAGQPGDPFGGEAIHGQGWCTLWLPPNGEKIFDWIEERLSGGE